MALSTFIIPPSRVTRTPVYVPVTQKTGTLLEPKYSIRLIDCGLESSCIHDPGHGCEECPLNKKEVCTAKPGDICYWGVHVTYGELSDEQRESVDRSVYLKIASE